LIFTSYSYFLFLVGVVALHWTLPRSLQNWLLIVASYVFYGLFRWDCALLLAAASVFTWAYARWILSRNPSLGTLFPAILVVLAPLVWFKYAGFLLTTSASVANLFGAGWTPRLGDLVLPLGISFYTFQAIAYLVDVASGEEALSSLPGFLLFQAFWPKLVSGPIVRMDEIRCQIEAPRTLDYLDVAEGSQRILWGLAKKVLLADNLAPVADMVFRAQSTLNAVDSVTGMLAVGMAIYFDFSAYTDIALGSARLVGFRLPENFNWPYLARSPQEFWNRWHMTLSRWIRDYLFTPLSFASRNRPGLAPVWLMVSMAVCGLWHGAAWTFVAWGLWHGLLLVLNQTLLKPLWGSKELSGRPLRGLVAMALTFLLVQLGWILFRADSLAQAWQVFQSILVWRGGLRPAVLREGSVLAVACFLAGLLLAQLVESRKPWLTRLAPHWIPALKIARPLLYAALILAIIVLDQEATAFVYFQF
jgi:alginate O-acetyltransferase complex protein AlgI